MLSYQHGYHAGNFADVIKHVTLTRLLHYMIQKPGPLLYLDTHSGKGLYDLKDKQALKTQEMLNGIQPLWLHRKTLPAVFTPYVQLLEQLNENDTLGSYPGSPWLAIQMLRSQDRLVSCELHPREFEALNQLSKQGKRIIFYPDDGLHYLQALLPPPERRGLIFMDPSYEVKTDYRQIVAALQKAYTRFSTGVYCLWYPLIDKKLHLKLVDGLSQIGTGNHLRIEFYQAIPTKEGMTGCGLWIINPPYVLASELKSALDTLKTLFNPGLSSYLIQKGQL
jgi:23S rRNA (adenine2030-N6)-methyltransferase